ncbi:MAG: helix-turn-helix transcriptional regulator [Oscillospiraceae bacterium]|nr:helix-turn-helix transcriptional regulator [Oscillospiraceae bacterium]
MISYAPLWETMKRKNATTYTLRTKGRVYNIGSATIKRLQTNQSVSTNTLDAICNILECSIPDIIEYIPDEKQINTD